MISNVKISLYPYYKIIRPLNCLIGSFALIVGILMTLGLEILINEFLIFSIGCVIMFFVSAGGFVINDIFDIEIDRINQPIRILPSNRISINSAYIYTIFLFSIAIILSVLSMNVLTNLNLGLIPLVFTLFGIVSLILYAKWFKQLGFFGNLLVTVLSLAPFLLGGILINNISRSLFPGLIVFLIIYSRELIKDIEDVKGDVEASNSFYSLPVMIGTTNTAYAVKILLIFMILVTFSPFFINEFNYFASYSVLIIGAVLNTISIKILFTLNGPEEKLMLEAQKGRKLLKIGVMVGLIGLSFNSFTRI